MSHELLMREPAKVLASLDQAVEIMKQIKGTVETASGIANMDLAIGGLDVAFKQLDQLLPTIDDAANVFITTKEAIELHVATFERNNDSITY